MSRPARPALARIAPVLIVAAATGGCATFSDDDLAARVGDEELTFAELEDRVAEFNAESEAVLAAEPIDAAGDAVSTPTTTPALAGEAARIQVGEWVRHRLLADAGLYAAYTDDPIEFGITCVDAFGPLSSADADDLLRRLAAGETWGDIVFPLTVADTRQRCAAVGDYGPLSDRIGALRPGGDAAAIDLADGTFALVRARSSDDVLSIDMMNAVQQVDPLRLTDVIVAAREADVFVDGRIGAFDPVTLSVSALG